MIPVDLVSLPAINKIIADAEEMLTGLCGMKVTVFIKIPQKDELNVLAIQQQICEAFEVSWSQIAGRSRKGIIPKARFAYCWICKQYLGMNLKEIGDTIGGRDHTTVIHALSTVKDLLDTKDAIMNPMLRVIESIYSEPKTA